MVYSQCRDQIVNGDHPLPKNEAIALAALQCCVDEGKYNQEKHVAGYFEYDMHCIFANIQVGSCIYLQLLEERE